MKKAFILLFLTAIIASCKKDDLVSEFNCENEPIAVELKEYRDVLKKFRVKLPKSWKTQLYYDDFQSQIFSADTTKSLTESYILDISWHQGELNLTEDFAQKVKDTLAIKEQLNVVKSNFSKFQDKPCFWTLSKGISNNYTFNNLQVYIKTEVDEYLTLTTKIYGDQNIDKRICESLVLSADLQIIE